MKGGEREGVSGEQYLLPSVLCWPPSPSFLALSQDPTGNKEGVAYQNREQSSTVSNPIAGLFVELPFAKPEQGDAPSAQLYCYGGSIAAFQANALVPLTKYGGGHDTWVVLPKEIVENKRIYYVNAKQYNAILRRRLSRAKIEGSVRVRKAYLHESRHLHAMRRARGCGGRFLNTKNGEPKTANITSPNQ